MNIFSFFSGAGFLDLGFELQGNFNVVFVNEFYKAFNDVYQYARQQMGIAQPIYGHHVEDITEYTDGKHEEKLTNLIELVNKSKQTDLTGFIGGPPCPDFSVAGRNKGRDGENGKLSGTYTELICRALPDFFVFENVLVNALEYGAPQDRDRIILIGFHHTVIERLHLPEADGKLLDFPWEAHKLFNLQTVKSLPWPTKTPYHENVKTEMPQGIIEDLTVLHWWKQNHIDTHPNKDMFFQPRAGLVRFQTKDEGDVEKKCYKRLHRWRYSPTAAYGNNEVHVHPFLPRRISVAEALAIQSLPANFVLPPNITLSDAFKTIGNGVPFVLAKGIASSISDYILIRANYLTTKAPTELLLIV